ncbi:NYN domain-containing protein [Methanofollis aquaemaris]|uniref:NYN domain-containing protein n=1 Tax=Methanofollis aquaemaris TaxID=126734 RepID=A0A8A3S5S8_9EURY|nr:NYN domain-containing protein [Methanofollis aquaemaris]QSZ67498.1 NYN domain-containing protein [Methanofollis aquaemaris]
MTGRAAVFIDNGYLSKVSPEGTKIDFEKFSDEACEGRERLRTYFYDCMPYQSDPPTEEERRRYAQYCKFRDIMEGLPRFQMRFGRLQKGIGETFEQKRVDILLAVDLVKLSWTGQIRYATVVTGDSDFVPAVDAAKDAGVIVTLYYSKKAAHNELLSAVDERREMDEEFFERIQRD